tara:strand:- start:764 stop:910 length:147 start_codon:yes stop_codon:yes gene_type:complete
MMKIIRNTKNKWNNAEPQDKVVVVLFFLYGIILAVILFLGLYLKIWDK